MTHGTFQMSFLTCGISHKISYKWNSRDNMTKIGRLPRISVNVNANVRHTYKAPLNQVTKALWALPGIAYARRNKCVFNTDLKREQCVKQLITLYNFFTYVSHMWNTYETHNNSICASHVNLITCDTFGFWDSRVVLELPIIMWKKCESRWYFFTRNLFKAAKRTELMILARHCLWQEVCSTND